ncbi:MAG: TetR/AcrR family transcriptional regulator [Bacillota bacterium]
MSIGTKNKIINASIKLFSSQGYKKTTTKAIADLAGVNEVTIFRQFGTKTGILEEIIESRMTHLESIKEYIKNKAQYDLQLDLFSIAVIYQTSIKRDIHLILALANELGSELHEQFGCIPKGLKIVLKNYFELYGAKKELNFNPEFLATYFISANIGYIFFQTITGTAEETNIDEAYIRMTIESFVNGIIKKKDLT